jgi:F-type H+-transporting ATPase subunit epsilon
MSVYGCPRQQLNPYDVAKNEGRTCTFALFWPVSSQPRPSLPSTLSTHPHPILRYVFLESRHDVRSRPPFTTSTSLVLSPANERLSNSFAPLPIHLAHPLLDLVRWCLLAPMLPWSNRCSYNKYTQVAARAVRSALKEPERIKAEKRAEVTLKKQTWSKGEPSESVSLSFFPLCR